MLDPLVRRLIDPPLDAAGRGLAAAGIAANQVTAVGFLLGLGGAAAVAMEAPLVGLGLFAANRAADGLDGAVARANVKTDLGGYFDIVADFIVYAAMVLGFAVADAERNALAGAVLLFAFMGTGSSFLAFAIFAARHGIETAARGAKSLYYLGGLTEGTETAAFITACCLWPAAFPWLAGVFAALCFLTTAGRVLNARQMLRGR